MCTDNAGTFDILKEIRRRLLEWGKDNFRSFPWRETRDPWSILIAEVLLHRTRANQVVPVYRTLLQRYPHPAAMAGASFQDLAEQVKSLGLHWRVPLMLEMAEQIVARHGGEIPASREALRALPGVSDYIAGAVCCLAFNLPEPVLDTNTVRVLGRLLGLPIGDSARRRRDFRERMQVLMEGESPRELLLAVLDLAATICKPRDPRCSVCPLQDVCYHGRAHGTEK